MNWNLILAAIHLIAGIGLFVYGYLNRNIEFSFPLYWGGSGTSGDPAYNLKGVYLVYAAAAFLVITGLFHLFYSQSKIYDYEIAAGRQRLRWLEYGITATIMVVIIAIISGVRDLYTIIALAGLSFGIMMTGLWFEGGGSGGSQSHSWIPIIVGFAMLAVVVYIILYNFFDEKKRYEAENSETLPTWITWSVIGTLGFFSIFGIVPVLQMLGSWSSSFNWSYMTYEKIYMILSATAKLYLGGLLGYGLIKRIQVEDESE